MSQTRYVVETTYNLTTPVCCDKMFHGELASSQEITPVDGPYAEEVIHRYCIHCGTKADYDIVRTSVATITQPAAVIIADATPLDEEFLVSHWGYTKCDFAFLVGSVNIPENQKQNVDLVELGTSGAYFTAPADDGTYTRPTLVIALSIQKKTTRVYRWSHADEQEVESAILDIVHCLKC